MPEHKTRCIPVNADPAPPPKVLLSILSVYIRLPLLRRTDQKANEGIRWDIIEENGVYERGRLDWLMVGTAQRLVLSAQIRQCARTAVMLLWCPWRQTWIDYVYLLISHSDFKYIINAQYYHFKIKSTHGSWGSPLTLIASRTGQTEVHWLMFLHKK